MFKSIKQFLEAIKVVNRAMSVCWDRNELPSKCGLHLSFERGKQELDFQRLKTEIGRDFPYRTSFSDPVYLKIVINDEVIMSSGNELENNINDGKPVTAESWKERCLENYNLSYDLFKLASPALMTLKQAKTFYPQITNCENLFDYWCLNTHAPGFLRGKLGGIGDMWELVKIAYHLIRFRDLTSKNVIISECGNGQGSNVLSVPDCEFLFWLHQLIFQDRLKALLFYDSALIHYNGGIEALKVKPN